MNRSRNGSQANARHHRQGDLIDHLTRVSRDDCCAEYLVGAFLYVNLDETHLIIVSDCPVDLVHRDGEGFPRNASLDRSTHVHPDMSNLRKPFTIPMHE